MSRSLLERLKDETVLAVRGGPDDWPRGLLSEAPIPDAWMGLVQRADGRRRLVVAGEPPRLERDDQLTLVRNRAIAVPCPARAVRSRDGYDVQVGCELLVRCPPREDELAAFRRTLLSAPELTLEQLYRRCDAAGVPIALARLAGARDAAELVREDLREAAGVLLGEALKRFWFESGLTLERVNQLAARCPALEQEETLQRATSARVQQIKSRELVEQAALAATHRRLDDLSGVLRKLETAADQDSRQQWHELLPALSPVERGKLLENLWRITPDQRSATAIVLIARQEVLWLDPQQPTALRQRVTLPADLGGLRSVTFDAQQEALLVGAANGVWILAASDGSIRGRCAVPDAPATRTGFNAATRVGSLVVATHSQLGAWAFPADGGPPRCLLAPQAGRPRTIRAAQGWAQGGLLLAADDAVHRFDASLEPLPPLEVGRPILALASLGSAAFVGTEEGLVLREDLAQPRELWEVVHRGADPIESLQARQWNDLVELVVPAGRQGVLGLYPAEEVTVRLLESPHAIRRAWSCDDLIVGLNDYRDRLIVLPAKATGRAGVDVAAARLAGAEIQDVGLVTAAPAVA